jgi:hypothetical protein
MHLSAVPVRRFREHSCFRRRLVVFECEGADQEDLFVAFNSAIAHRRAAGRLVGEPRRSVVATVTTDGVVGLSV